MIRISGCLEYGWELVKECVEDELTDDSEDDKRLCKAEKETEKIASRKEQEEFSADSTTPS